MAKPAALADIEDPFKAPERYRPTKTPDTVGELQAAVEGVPTGRRIEFMGESYRLADKIGLMPLLRFAYAARKGTDADDMEGLAAIYDMLHDCIDPSEWDRFQVDATAKKAEAEELLTVVSQTIELMTARPTQRPSDSSAGPSTTSAKLTESSPLLDTPDGQAGEKFFTVDDLLRQAGG